MFKFLKIILKNSYYANDIIMTEILKIYWESPNYNKSLVLIFKKVIDFGQALFFILFNQTKATCCSFIELIKSLLFPVKWGLPASLLQRLLNQKLPFRCTLKFENHWLEIPGSPGDRYWGLKKSLIWGWLPAHTPALLPEVESEGICPRISSSKIKPIYQNCPKKLIFIPFLVSQAVFEDYFPLLS